MSCRGVLAILAFISAIPAAQAQEARRTVERVDTSCRLSAEAREQRIQFALAQMRIWNGEIQQLGERSRHAIDRRFWLAVGDDAATVCMVVSAAAGAAAGVAVLAEAVFAAPAVLIAPGGTASVGTLSHGAMGLGAGEALVGSGSLFPAGMTVSGSGMYATLLSRLGMVGLEMYHILSPARSYGESFRRIHAAAEETIAHEPYLNADARRFLEDPSYEPGPHLSSRGLRRMPMDYQPINRSMDRLLTFQDRAETALDEEPVSWIEWLDPRNSRETSRAALHVATLQQQLTLMNLKMRYWGDLVRILRLDAAACAGSDDAVPAEAPAEGSSAAD